jgi:hypothetical protein
MGIAYSPTQQLSKTARMPITLVQYWRNTEEDIHEFFHSDPRNLLLAAFAA